MMRSLYSGVSGLRVHQTKMDVIGNNIANVNTVGFKSSSVTFSDVFYQTLQSATGPNADTGAGGQNAKQIGLGSNVASITAAITKTGGSQRTDNASDLMITGDAFFIVNSGGTNYFTKAGSFGLDEDGNLVTPSGAKVMGWPTNEEGTEIVSGTVKPLQITSPDNAFSAPEATKNTYVSGNIDYNDPQLKDGKTINLEFFDALGQKYTAILRVTKTASNEVYNVTVDDILDTNSQSLFVNKDADGKYVKAAGFTEFTFAGINYKADAVDETTGKVTFSKSGTAEVLRFDGANGKFKGVGIESNTNPTGKGFSLSIGGTGAIAFGKPIDVDFSLVTMFENGGKTVLEPDKGSVKEGKISPDGAGKRAGSMTGYKIDTSGKIYGTYSNGDTKLLGQIAVTTFNNPAGLESIGGNMFAQTLNSGTFDGIGQDITATGGQMNSGMLEMSNVDLSAEFTEMITTQRGFQANSRIITTSDTMLEELINLKR